jgi:hypothetical protein
MFLLQLNKLNLDEICTSRNNEQKWVTNFHIPLQSRRRGCKFIMIEAVTCWEIPRQTSISIYYFPTKVLRSTATSM